jgi:hypothetical protein
MPSAQALNQDMLVGPTEDRPAERPGEIKKSSGFLLV